MKYAGIDLHKQSITVCVMNQDREKIDQKRFDCKDEEKILKYFISLGDYEVVIESTSSYRWLARLLEGTAKRLVLAHPKKLRIIAESARKSDKLDARVLAEFLALDMIPQAYRPGPRQSDHRRLVRHRKKIRGRITSVKCRIRNILANYNADRKDLFGKAGIKYMKSVGLSSEDRFSLDMLLNELYFFLEQKDCLDKRLRDFAKKATIKEKEARSLLATIPGVGEQTIEVIIAEIGDMSRFSSAKKVVDYAGLSPGHRESAGFTKDIGITKEGPRQVRWILTQAAWTAVRYSTKWKNVFEEISKRRGRKKAIIAVARRLLCVMHSMLRTGQPYRFEAS